MNKLSANLQQMMSSPSPMVTNTRNRIVTGLLLLLCCAWVLLQSPLAPGANQLPWIDSGVFIYGAKAGLSGQVLYKDFFDHKGPLIYLINRIGLQLSPAGTFTGIWLMEYLNLLLAAVFFYKTAKIFSGGFAALVLTVYMLLSLTYLLLDGNLTEEYALSFQCIALYYYIRIFRGERQIGPATVLPIACCCAAVCLLKINLVMIWVACSLVLGMMLYKQQRSRELVLYISLFAAGTALVWTPFLVYFIVTRSLNDFYQAYWVFNRAYAASGPAEFWTGLKASAINTFATGLLPLFLLYLVWCCIRRSWSPLRTALTGAILLTLLLSCALSGNGFAHYDIALLPLSLFLAIWAAELKAYKRYMASFLLSLLLLLSAGSVKHQVERIRFAYTDRPVIREIVRIIRQHTEPGDCIAVLGNNVKFYLLSERSSCSKYTYQVPIRETDTNIWRHFVEDVKTMRPAFILLQAEIQDTAFRNFLNKTYIQRDTLGVDYLLRPR
jgi:hypothetical protein